MIPQVDLETQVAAPSVGGNGSRVAYGTQADGGAVDDEPPKNDVVHDEHDSAEVPPDSPPESFWLSKDAEYDWFDRNAFLERKESTKGISNPHTNPASNASSQRFSANLKSKASIIGLPKTQKTTFIDSKRRTCKTAANARLFPKRIGSVGKSNVPVAEPGSPKVSCMGRVRSRGRRRSNSLKRTAKAPITTGSEKQNKIGFCSMVIGFFLCNMPARSGSRKVVEALDVEEQVVVDPQLKSVSVKVEETPVGSEAVAEPPGLGGMKRFVSGRRSASWASDDLYQEVSGELERRDDRS